MKSTFTFFILSFLLVSNCIGQDKKTDDLAIKTAVTKVLDNWHKAASKANYDTYFDLMDDKSIFIGTDTNEVWTKDEFQKFSKPFFDKGKAWSFTSLKKNIYIHSSKNIVWFDEILDTWMGICRGSGVLEKSNNQWKIKHYVLSLTIPNENIKPIIKIKQEKDSLFINTLGN